MSLQTGKKILHEILSTVVQPRSPFRWSPASGLTLDLERLLAVPPELVFDAFVDPQKLGDWWGPHGFTCRSVELDVRVGGRYRIAMQPPDGDIFHLRGEFLEIEPARRLAYTFEWEEADPDDQETLATLSFLAHDCGTRLVLEQGPFKTEARHALHHAGWTDTLERLEAFLSD